MRLQPRSYLWAITHVEAEGDNDLFPIPFEFKAIGTHWGNYSKRLEQLEIEHYSWGTSRRFLIPKEDLAFRTATQLEPQDGLVLAALIYEFGAAIEKRRIPFAERKCFSYRFNPSNNGRFYGETSSWHEFWQTSFAKADQATCKFVAVADITDFYNQIYHHTLENELAAAQLPSEAISAIHNLLSAITHGVSRGIPIGPHAAHLLAECTLVPTDASLKSHGYDFCRYVDDFHFFCNSRDQAEIAIFRFAEILDKQQRLTLQKQKTKIYTAEEFKDLAQHNLIDRPLNKDEADLLNVIKKHAGHDPYMFVTLGDLDEADLRVVERTELGQLVALYLSQDPVDYLRLGWLLRRLAQVGNAAALECVLENLSRLTPIMGLAGRYVLRARNNYSGSWERIGTLILDALELPIVRQSEYLQLVLLNLFSEMPELNHIDKLTARFSSYEPYGRREIIAAAAAANQGHWIKELKDDFKRGDPWMRRAIVAAARTLPGDEGEYWIRKIWSDLDLTERIVAVWAFKGPIRGLSV